MSKQRKRKPSIKPEADVLTMESVEGAILDTLSVIDEHRDVGAMHMARLYLEDAADEIRAEIDSKYEAEEA